MLHFHSIFKLFLLVFYASSFLGIKAFGQKIYPKQDFISPLEIPLYLAGNFGELRSNHFHSGIDIKTQGRTGLNVFAVANGYVSRIKVSPYGYGKAIYIRHANGYTTVYAHLESFTPEIEAYVNRQQYAQKTFKIELYPGAKQFVFKQGDQIGVSGNSGGSVAPHLHFEIRETASEIPVNPLLFEFDIKDDIPPVISELHLYPADNETQINGKSSKKMIRLSGSNGSYSIPQNQSIEVSGPFFAGLRMFDRLNEMQNKCGVFEVNLRMDDVLMYHHRMEKFAFRETRYLNALVDYDLKMRKDVWVEKSVILPNNKLSIYGVNKKDGLLNPTKEISTLEYEVLDAYGNKSTLNINIKRVTQITNEPGSITQKPVKKFKYNQANSFESENVLVYLPSNVLYEDLDFNFWVDDTLENALCPLYNIHDINTPLHSYMALSINLANIHRNIRKYCMIISLDEDGKVVSEGGYWKGDYLIVKTRSFGAYTVKLDSIRPTLTPINLPENADMSNKKSIIIKAEDNLSGVDKYDAYIDEQWVLLEFDYKKKRLMHYFRDDLTQGPHTFKMVVRDKIGNQTILETDFVR